MVIKDYVHSGTELYKDEKVFDMVILYWYPVDFDTVALMNFM